MTADRDATRELEERLKQYPAERYPVQHATAQFHLGVALAHRGDVAAAERSLSAAVRLFEPERLPLEHAKALNALGGVIRQSGRSRAAIVAFERAAALFEAAGAGLEQGAALFNLGVAQREAGEDALPALLRARELLDERRVPGQAAAAAREVGATRLLNGRVRHALRELEHAVALADTSGDAAGLGHASNLLGLAHLAAGQPAPAVDAFSRAAASHPRSIRPGDHAAAKANLALAYEGTGDAARARLAARHALGAREVPVPVREQAAALLARLGDADGDLFRVLEDEPLDRWHGLMRDEIACWLDTDPPALRARADEWVSGVLLRSETGPELAAAWVGALVELPPDAMDRLVRATLEALSTRRVEEQSRFRGVVAQATARLHTPQLIRLKDTFNRVAGDLGQEPDWS